MATRQGGLYLWQLLPEKASSIKSISATLCPSLPQLEEPVEYTSELVETTKVCSCRTVPVVVSADRDNVRRAATGAGDRQLHRAGADGLNVELAELWDLGRGRVLAVLDTLGSEPHLP